MTISRLVVHFIAIELLLVGLTLGWQFAQVARAERALARAAEAGALEASLPRATRRSVAAAVERAWSASQRSATIDPVTVFLNGRPILDPLLPPLGKGDEVSVLASLPALAVTGDALTPLGLSPAPRRLRAVARRCQP